MRMSPISVTEAEPQLDDLIRQAAKGEEVVIRGTGGAVVRLVPVEVPGRPRFGSARGMFTMADDFDAPLDDFAPYER
jgi:antitoxin (DNA-binding transcriptional repressor) of toxin-antitoxin stability system